MKNLVYLRKIFPHDVTKEVSFTSDIHDLFFEGQLREIQSLNFYKSDDTARSKKYSVWLSGPEDPRFNGDFKTVCKSYYGGGDLVVGDIIVIKKINKTTYELQVVKSSQSEYKFVNSLFSDGNRHAIITEGSDEKNDLNDTKKGNDVIVPFPLQRIFYGAPGTGKSFSIKNVIKEHNGKELDMEDEHIFRTTFHPDYDYAQFVGCYKPTKTKPVEYVFVKDEVEYKTELDKINSGAEGEKVCKRINLAYCNLEIAEKYVDKIDKEKEKSSYSDTRNGINLAKLHAKTGATQTPSITYEFVPQVFTNALVKSYENSDESVYLVIEEINRGNCAQIFGDIFQLLDRNANGESEYAINVDEDLKKYLQDYFSGSEKIDEEYKRLIDDGKIKLPRNFNIIATMNTSDQSLFPMDSAFKRRWEWQYVPIKYKNIDKDGKEVKLKITVEENKYEYDWNKFQEAVNKEILKATHSEDKQMGDYFIKKNVNLDEFINKVMFYLWNDVCKENYHSEDNFFRKKNEINEAGEGSEFSFGDLIAYKETYVIGFMNKLGVDNLIKTPSSVDESQPQVNNEQNS